MGGSQRARTNRVDAQRAYGQVTQVSTMEQVRGCVRMLLFRQIGWVLTVMERRGTGTPEQTQVGIELFAKHDLIAWVNTLWNCPNRWVRHGWNRP